MIITLKIPTMRGKLSIQLKSPAGTVSQLLFPRNKDTGKTGFDNWQFMSVHHWEETAVGEWEFVFKNDHAIATGARTNYWCFRERFTVIKSHERSEYSNRVGLGDFCCFFSGKSLNICSH